MEEKLKKIIKHYGPRNQLKKLAEEILNLKANSIPKSVIRDKIEELEINLSSVIQMNESMARFTTIQKLDYQIKILKEILGET